MFPPAESPIRAVGPCFWTCWDRRSMTGRTSAWVAVGRRGYRGRTTSQPDSTAIRAASLQCCLVMGAARGAAVDVDGVVRYWIGGRQPIDGPAFELFPPDRDTRQTRRGRAGHFGEEPAGLELSLLHSCHAQQTDNGSAGQAGAHGFTTGKEPQKP